MSQADIGDVEGLLSSGGAMSGGLKSPGLWGSDDRWGVVGLGEMCVGGVCGGSSSVVMFCSMQHVGGRVGSRNRQFDSLLRVAGVYLGHWEGVCSAWLIPYLYEGESYA